jgi:arginine/lysine/ornithine decarboxylase
MVRDNRRAQGNSAPLLEALEDYARHERLGFHMPGHQQGLGLPPAFTRLLTSYGAAFDLTELPGLDHLAAPSGSIEKSQKAMADSAGSALAYYLVNGSTGGLEAAMLAMSGPDTVTVMPNCCHSAVYSGLVLTGSMPVILPSLVDPQWGLPLGLDKKAAESFLEQDAGAMGKALWVSLNPTYHGVMADLAWETRVLGKNQPGAGWLMKPTAHICHISNRRTAKGDP